MNSEIIVLTKLDDGRLWRTLYICNLCKLTFRQPSISEVFGIKGAEAVGWRFTHIKPFSENGKLAAICPQCLPGVNEEINFCEECQERH